MKLPNKLYNGEFMQSIPKMTYEDYKILLAKQYELKKKYLDNEIDLTNARRTYMAYLEKRKGFMQEILKNIKPPV